MSFVVDMFAAVTKWQGESVRLSGRYAGPDRVLSSILPAKYCLAVYLSAVIEVQSDADERIDGRETVAIHPSLSLQDRVGCPNRSLPRSSSSLHAESI